MIEIVNKPLHKRVASNNYHHGGLESTAVRNQANNEISRNTMQIHAGNRKYPTSFLETGNNRLHHEQEEGGPPSQY